eukprot:56357-Chlamydomonas_euryale.AAC.10
MDSLASASRIEQTGSARSYLTSTSATCRRDSKAQGLEKGQTKTGNGQEGSRRKEVGREEATPKEGRRQTGKDSKGGESEDKKEARAGGDKTRQGGRLCFQGENVAPCAMRHASCAMCVSRVRTLRHVPPPTLAGPQLLMKFRTRERQLRLFEMHL